MRASDATLRRWEGFGRTEYSIGIAIPLSHQLLAPLHLPMHASAWTTHLADGDAATRAKIFVARASDRADK